MSHKIQQGTTPQELPGAFFVVRPEQKSLLILQSAPLLSSAAGSAWSYSCRYDCSGLSGTHTPLAYIPNPNLLRRPVPRTP